MGACATKPADLKVKGAEKLSAGDVSRRSSLSELLKEVAEQSDGEAPVASEKTATAASNKTVATEEQPLTVTGQPSMANTSAKRLEEPEATA